MPHVLQSTMSKVMRAGVPVMVNALLWLFLPAPWLIAQTIPARVEIRFGTLDTTSYPSPAHPTEWKQQLIADLYDSAGHALPASPNYMYTWGVDFCKGFGVGFGWAAGYGLSSISPDGNKLKSETGCCALCPFQTYLVAVRVNVEDYFLQSRSVLIPNIAIPEEPAVSSNYPNPFSSRTYIRFQLNDYSHVQLRVFNCLGQSLGELLNQYLPPGYHTMTWHPTNNPGGVYFYRLTINPNNGPSLTRTEKMMLLK